MRSDWVYTIPPKDGYRRTVNRMVMITDKATGDIVFNGTYKECEQKFGISWNTIQNRCRPEYHIGDWEYEDMGYVEGYIEAPQNAKGSYRERRVKKKPKDKPKADIRTINARAKAKGMTYGEYMTYLHWHPEEQREIQMS